MPIQLAGIGQFLRSACWNNKPSLSINLNHSVDRIIERSKGSERALKLRLFIWKVIGKSFYLLAQQSRKWQSGRLQEVARLRWTHTEELYKILMVNFSTCAMTKRVDHVEWHDASQCILRFRFSINSFRSTIALEPCRLSLTTSLNRTWFR